MSGKSETYHFERALVGESLAENVLVEVDGEGVISTVRADAPATGSGRIEGIALPGMANLHSHAFQRAMAGLTERASEGGNNFWAWRQTLYRVLAELSAGDIEAIATILYMEMLKAGYTSVGEFHYLHHRPDGKPYSSVAVTSEAIFKAANAAGLALTHLPALYMTSGFGDDHLSVEQRRFYNDYGRFSGLLKEIVSLAEGYSNISVGLALHSLRAVPQAVIGPAIQLIEGMAPGAPIHIHIAEQDQEVADCLNFYDAHPVEWLLKQVRIDQRWCLVHATHLDANELMRFADSGAIAGLCPTTEANLGDGIFPLKRFLEAGGRFGIGSDSHVSIDPREELRLLEYGQRLFHLERSVATDAVHAHPGPNLWSRAAEGGATALGRKAGRLEAGYQADIVVVDANSPAIMGADGLAAVDSFVFTGAANPVRYVLVGGEWQVRKGVHVREQEILAEFGPRVAALRAKISKG